MASKLGVTALYVTPTQESGGSFDPRAPRIAATDLALHALALRVYGLSLDLDSAALASIYLGLQ